MFKSRSILIENGETKAFKEARAHSLDILETAVSSVDPYKLVKRYIQKTNFFRDSVENYNNIYLLGFGKASVAMAKAAFDLLKDKIREGIVITNDPTKKRCVDSNNVKTYLGTHPLPSEKNIQNTEKALENSYMVAQSIYEFMKKNKIEFDVKASGSKGFHFVVYWESLKEYFPYNSFMDVTKTLTYIVIDNLTEKEKQYIDISVNRKKGLFRAKFSLHPKTLLVALPLTEKEFETFDIELLNPDYLIGKDLRKRKTIINEGLGIRHLVKSHEVFELLKQHISEQRKEIEKTKEQIKKLFLSLDKTERINILKEIEGLK